jgi:hypothetical protein
MFAAPMSSVPVTTFSPVIPAQRRASTTPGATKSLSAGRRIDRRAVLSGRSVGADLAGRGVDG